MAKRKKKVPGVDIDWYLISIDRLKQIALVILLILLGLGSWWYFVHEKANPRSAAESAMAEARQALNALASSKDFSQHRNEFDRAQRKLDQAGALLAGAKYVDAESAAVESQTPQADHSRESKIAALGIHISRGVTSHGIAINVSTDLTFFNLIVPCGITSKPVTSMARELGRAIPMQEVAHSLSRNVGTVFQSQILWLDNLDALLGTNLGVPVKAPDELRKIHGDDPAWA
jgi:hypothetical protein